MSQEPCRTLKWRMRTFLIAECLNQSAQALQVFHLGIVSNLIHQIKLHFPLAFLVKNSPKLKKLAHRGQRQDEVVIPVFLGFLL